MDRSVINCNCSSLSSVTEGSNGFGGNIFSVTDLSIFGMETCSLQIMLWRDIIPASSRRPSEVTRLGMLYYNSFHIKAQTNKMSAIHSQSSSDALIVISANIEGLTANKHPYYQSCARINIATVYVSKKPTEPKFIGGI